MHNAPDPLAPLFDACTPDAPLARLVERQLDAVGGSVPADEAELDRAASRLHAKISTSSVPASLPIRWGLVASVGVALAAGVLLAVWAMPATVEEPKPRVTTMAPAATVVVSDTVVLQQGTVRITPDSEAHRVQLTAVDAVVEPIGTIYFAGVDSDLAAVGVTEGRVRIVHDGQTRSELLEGDWAILFRSDSGPDIRTFDGSGPPDLSDISAERRDRAKQLVAQMRWSALSPESQEAIAPGRTR